jgi:glutamyl-tRNA reductase
MVLVLVGASHHDASLEEIERLSHAGTALASTLVDHDGVSGALVLSTCNRFEVYLDLDRFHEAIELTTREIADKAGIDHADVVESMRVTMGTSVAQHLFSVASGLESMVVGEDEVAGQVKSALAAAQVAATTSPTLERMMQRALATSKAVTNMTGLGAAGRSIVSVGLDLVEERHGSLEGRTALVLGTGSYARVVTSALARRGVTETLVYSSSGRAAKFASSHGISPVTDDELAEAIARVDLVAACSGAPHHIIDSVLLDSRRTAGGVLPVIDLALSPDVAPEVRDRPDVDVIDLEVIRVFAPREHSSAVLEAQEIVRGAVECFERSETGRTADPAVVAMRAYVSSIINEEIERTRGRLGDDTADEVARSLHRVSNALLHTPSVRAQELARTGDIDDYRKAMHTLFGIDFDATAAK